MRLTDGEDSYCGELFRVGVGLDVGALGRVS
jgi:hypothetical protein